MFIFDAHLDLSMNAMEWNRDLRNNVSTLRHLEKGWKINPTGAAQRFHFRNCEKEILVW